MFGDAPSRMPGSPGNLAVEAAIAREFAASGLRHGEMTFETPCFLPGKTTVSLSDGRSVSLLPMHPGLFRPGNFRERAFKSSVVYAGRASEDDLKALEGIQLNGSIALLEFDCGDEWQRLLRFGVLGFIFIDDGTALNQEAQTKLIGTEVRVPRFQVNAESGSLLKGAVKTSGGALEVQISAEPSRWENRTVRDLWVLVPGTSKERADDAVLITAPMDANGIVPSLAVGGQNGANLLLMMELFRRFRKAPPERTVIFCAVNAHTHNYLGERTLAWNLLVPRNIIEKSLDTINNDLREEEMLLGHYNKFNLNPPNAQDSELLISLRDLVDATTGRNFTVKEPIVDLARREVNVLKGKLLHLARDKSLSAEELDAKRRELEDLRHHYVNVLTLFNKVGVKTTLEDLDHIPFMNSDGTKGDCRHQGDFELNILRGYVNDIVTSRDTWAKLNRAEIKRVSDNNAIREALGTRLVKFVLCLELDWDNECVGLAACDFSGAGRWQHKFGLNAAAVANNLAASPEFGSIRFIDALTRRGGMPEGHFYQKASETVTPFQASNRTPAFSIRNVYTDFGAKFSTGDTPASLNATRVNATVNYVCAYLRALLSDENITKPSELSPASPPNRLWAQAWGTQVKAFRFDDFSASVLPQLPVPGAVMILQDPMDANKPLRSGDVITGYITITDERAVTNFQCVTAASLNTNAFEYDADFIDVKGAIDAGEAETKMASVINRGVATKVLALFHCVEYPIYTRDNPATIGVIPITEESFLVLNGRLNSAPKKFGMTGISSTFSNKKFNRMPGPVAFYLEADVPLKLLTSERVLALNTTDANPLGNGFTKPAKIGTDFFATAAKDMSRLNKDRMEKLSGTSDELSKVFKTRGDQAIADAMAARDKCDWLEYLSNLHLATGAHLKAYKRMTAVTNDMLKAVVFYLALMLPFCFFAEKLLFKFKKIEQEMAAFCGMFVLTFIVFRKIHPAFRVAQAPEAIFIAFVMGGLGAFVIKILHGRFEGEMQLLFRTSSVFDTGQAGFSTVGQSAMLIGVNNMKRRRIRTALTTATIVLVTFTMLAFTSISKKMSPTVVRRSSKAPYTGLMYHWPGNARMDEATVRTFEEILNDRAHVCVRRWLLPQKVSEGELPFMLIASNGKQANVDAFLGLSKEEPGFIGPLPIAKGTFFSSDSAHEVIFPEALAKAIGIDLDKWQNYTISILGTEYKLVGILDDLTFQKFEDINQRPIIPIKSLIQQANAEQDLTAMAAGNDEDADDNGVFYTDLSSLAILPIHTCQSLGGQPYSISAKLDASTALWPIVDELLTITNASKFYISSLEPFQIGDAKSRSSEAGVYYIGEGYRTSIGGLAFLLIPLLISATIILNTMLGSVYERKAEIAIYNAVGLNPTHIGMFFLAEAFVYSVIGSVGGYLIGQCLSIFLARTEIISGINLNFSSLSVVYVIMFTVTVVMLSTIYPSIVATRAAVPSGKRKWSLPHHDGKNMEVVFPFIYQASLIRGINAYLDDYFARFTEASFGDLIANCEGTKIGKDADGRDTLEITYRVALAPFDLGVTELLKFNTAYDQRVQAYRLVMLNTRLSGQDSNWTATNMPFLEKLRTYLMYWRNLSPAEQDDFCRKGHDIFGKDVQLSGSPSMPDSR